MSANDSNPTTPHVFLGLAEVQAEINRSGISKSQETTSGARYNYRGVDKVMDAFAGPLSRAKVMILPSFSEALRDRTPTNNGSVVMVQVTGTFRAVSLVDGSEVVLGSFYGEGTDSLDKATVKAQSVALRTCYLQTFTCPIGPENDPETSDETGGVDERKSAEADAGKGTKVASKPKTKAKPAAVKQASKTKPAGKGSAPLSSVSPGRQMVLDRKLEARGKSLGELVDALGEPVTDENFDAAIAKIKEL